MKTQGSIHAALLLLAIFLCLSPVISRAQMYIPAKQDSLLLVKLFSTAEAGFKAELSGFKSADKNDYKKIYQQRWDNIKESFDSKEVSTATEYQKYLDGIKQEIITANSFLKKDSFNCYFSRSGVPNAAFLGEGIILFNMGLFRKLENESQVAFVLCHEISHYYLRHSDKSIEKYVTTINSPELQKQLKEISRKEYGKRKQLEELMKGMTFSSRRHSRDHESQADSMAVEMLSHTKYDVGEALKALSLLDSIDIDKGDMAEIIEKTFDSKEFPFNKKWLKKEDGLLGGHTEIAAEDYADSIKTHPDCKKRVAAVTPLVMKYKQSLTSPSVQFNETASKFSYEIIHYAFVREHLSQSLYYTLLELNKTPGDAYLLNQVSKILEAIYKAGKAHKLGNMVDQPSPYQSKNYNTLLQFIQNLYMEDVASLEKSFNSTHSLK